MRSVIKCMDFALEMMNSALKMMIVCIATAHTGRMRHQEYGRILLTSSGASFGAKNYWLYGTAKAAMIGMANNLKHEGKDLNIKVAICIKIDGFRTKLDESCI